VVRTATNQHDFRFHFFMYIPSYSEVDFYLPVDGTFIMVSSRGDRLSNALRARKVPKHYALAVDIGVDQSAISRWKKDGSISTDHVARLC